MANYTRKAIISGFEEMLQEMSFNKITVSALIERCEISSNTFYYHFNNIYDLLDTWIDLRVQDFMMRNGPIEHWDIALKQLLREMKENPALIYHVSDAIPRDRLERYAFVSAKPFFTEFAKLHSRPDANADHIRGLADLSLYAFCGIVLEFIWGHMEADIDSTVDRISCFFKQLSD